MLFAATNSLARTGQITAAIAAYTDLTATAAATLCLGPDHPCALTTRNNLAVFQGDAGDVAGAAAALEEALADMARVLGPDHPDTLATRGAPRPQARRHAGDLQTGPVARSMKELLVLLEDELHAREVNLEVLTGICAGLHKPNGRTIADKMLFMVAAMAAEMERDLIHEPTMDGLAAAAAQGRYGGRPAAVDDDTLAITRARRSRGESVTWIAAHLKIGRPTLYRALAETEATVGASGWRTPGRRRESPAGSRPAGCSASAAAVPVVGFGNGPGATGAP